MYTGKYVFYKGQKLYVRQLREKVIAIHGRQCQYCASKENLTLDHILSLHFGGTWDLSNLQILCKDCNNKKGCRKERDLPIEILVKRRLNILKAVLPLPGNHILSHEYVNNRRKS